MSSQRLNRIAQAILLTIWLFTIIANVTRSVNSQVCPKPQYMDENSICCNLRLDHAVEIQLPTAREGQVFSCVREGFRMYGFSSAVMSTSRAADVGDS
jgi:hypothetical protein